jgi:hypothetical protein
MMKAPRAHAVRGTLRLFPSGFASAISASLVGRFWLAAKLAGYPPSAKFVISLCIISFLHG